MTRLNSQSGWIRTAAALSQKTAQKQPSGLFLAARLAKSTRAHQKTSTYASTLRFLFCNKAGLIERADSNSNSDDRCQRQKQGGVVGAAASRMRVPSKARCSRWEPRPGFLFSAARAIHPHLQKTATYQNTLRFCFFTVVFSLRPPIRAAGLEYCFAQ